MASAIWWVRSKQRHSAREQLIELVRIHYPFHPRVGLEVEVLGRSRLGENDFLIIRQPDGTRAHLPQWMTLPSAACVAMHSPPHISSSALRALRLELDAVLSSLAGATPPGGVDEAKQPVRSVRPVQQSSGSAGIRESGIAPQRTRRSAKPTSVGGGTQHGRDDDTGEP